jgi:type II secretory pathway predicted ATPase ExeA
MNSKKLLSLYGLKWNPFTADVPAEALLVTKKIESFAFRIESLVHDGGFALISGDPGTGKSVVLRVLAERLKTLRDVVVGVVERPQSKVGDFYRELGEIFQVKLAPSNRYGGFKLLRERWRSHVESHLLRPVLLVDEAQETPVEVLSELRLLASAQFDSVLFLTVILSGDSRLPELFRHEDLVPLGTRIRTRLVLDYASKDELRDLLHHAMAKAGNSKLMTDELVDTLVDHAGGNQRALMNMAAELLSAGMGRDGAQLDELLYLEVFQLEAPRPRAKAKLKEGR